MKCQFMHVISSYKALIRRKEAHFEMGRDGKGIDKHLIENDKQMTN